MSAHGVELAKGTFIAQASRGRLDMIDRRAVHACGYECGFTGAHFAHFFFLFLSYDCEGVCVNICFVASCFLSRASDVLIFDPKL